MTNRAMAVGDAGQIVCDRGQAASPVDQDRNVALGSEREDRREPLVVQQELLGPGMQLDSTRAAVEDARRLADRVLREVEADERDHPASRPLGELQRAVVAGAEARMPVGFVQAEHEAAGDAVLVHPTLQVLVDPDHAVDVGPEMRVGVEDVGALRQLPAKLVVPLRHQHLGTLQRVPHALESMRGPVGFADTSRVWHGTGPKRLAVRIRP